ncbi:Glyco_18 domain-containing protein [Psidium guajava]|nr:Glyco_18 domain-containing protein [Psidium guajava]
MDQTSLESRWGSKLFHAEVEEFLIRDAENKERSGVQVGVIPRKFKAQQAKSMK